MILRQAFFLWKNYRWKKSRLSVLPLSRLLRFISTHPGTGAALIGLRPDGPPETVWKSRAMQNQYATSVLFNGCVYGFSGQRLVCLDWETGELTWEGGRFGDPGSCVVTADGRLVVLGGQGRLALVETADRSPARYAELAAREGILHDSAWPHVVLSDIGLGSGALRRGRCRAAQGRLFRQSTIGAGARNDPVRGTPERAANAAPGARRSRSSTSRAMRRAPSMSATCCYSGRTCMWSGEATGRRTSL